MTDAELEGFRNDRYFARSWALLTRDRGWIKPVLAMTAALLVPVVGWLGVSGYVLEWARLTAWGVTSAPKQKGVRVGACIAAGFRAFVVALVWGICRGLISSLLDAVPFYGDMLVFVWDVLGICLLLATMVAELRATIYQKVVAGLRVPTIWAMVSRDPGGLARVLGMLVAGFAIMGVVSAIILSATVVSLLPQLIDFFDYYLEYEGVMSQSMVVEFSVRMFVSLFVSMGPGLVALILVDAFLGVIVSMLCYTALGLWMRQFDVARWGREEDPLPGYAPASTPVAPLPAAGPAADQAAAPGHQDPENPITED